MLHPLHGMLHAWVESDHRRSDPPTAAPPRGAWPRRDRPPTLRERSDGRGIAAASIGVRFQMRRDQQRQQESFTKAVDAAIERITAARDDTNRILHERISKIRDDHFKELPDRTAKIEGQLVGIGNTLHIIQQRYIGRDE